MKKTVRIVLYFVLWIIFAVNGLLLNFLNMNWEETSIFNGIAVMLLLGALQGCVMEFPLQTIFTIAIGGHTRNVEEAKFDHLSLILNYNLLATSKDDIDECLKLMFDAYMGNLAPKISAVLVSATDDEDLKDYEIFLRNYYRQLIFDQLYAEGLAFARREYGAIDNLHLMYVWKPYQHIDSAFFTSKYLHDICQRYCKEFMVLHRVSRVLRKCGQYQDLMLLSNGNDTAFTYCDKEYYGSHARRFGEPLFHHSADVENIFARKLNYTLVLDSDTSVPHGSVFKMLGIAAANPDKGIIQPAVKLVCNPGDTIFMHLETIRQDIYEPMTNAIGSLFQQSAFFGKALINNRIYIRNILYKKNKLIERVPIDVLSHDTFEASLLRPLYAGSVYLLEEPSYNYVTWNIRERRWNRGELLNATYFWKTFFGGPVRCLQKCFQRGKFVRTKLRTETDLDFVTSYMAHAALRQMCMKPLLLLYIVLHTNISLYHVYPPIAILMFLVLVFPKFAICTRNNLKLVLCETMASILQFTPESVVGCVRIMRAFQANIAIGVKWVPQKAVENEFRRTNPFLSAFKHLWGYSLFGAVVGIVVTLYHFDAMLIFIMLATLILLPVFTGVTTLPFGCLTKYKNRVNVESNRHPSSCVSSISSGKYSKNNIHSKIQHLPTIAWSQNFPNGLSVL